MVSVAAVANSKKGGFSAQRARRVIHAVRRRLNPDLSKLISDPFRPLVEHAVLAPWFTSSHRLRLSDALGPGMGLVVEGAAGPGAISRLTMVADAHSYQTALTAPIATICDAFGSTLACVALRAEPLAGSCLLVGSFQPFLANPHERLFIQVQGKDWRLYEWRRDAFLKSRHRGLFGRLS
jgi:hypothetical protein